MSFSSPRPAAISIDFGTSHTVATIRRADGRVHQQLFDGSPQLPSAVFIDDEGGPVVGADAVHSGRRKPERYEPNPKRRIDDAQILLGETEIPVTSVIAAVLSRVARECEQTLGSLGPVTVTVPAAWGPTRRHVVADAATAAGLGTVDLVAEPVAAASYFTTTLDIDLAPENGVVVYDLGGGTFDATVLRRSDTGFDVLAVDGAADLGGLDFDQALAEHVAATFHPEDERWARLTHPSAPADLRHRTAFMDEIRLAKERLSRSTATDLTIPLLDLDAHLTRDELEQVCAPLVERTIRVTQGVIRESGLANEQVSGLFLVGAASRMPLVATLLHRELGIAPAAIEQPELAVSEGGLVAQHTVNTPISVPSPALPPQTATPAASLAAPTGTPTASPIAPIDTPTASPVAHTAQTMQLPTPSAPPSHPTPQPSPSQPTPQSMPAATPSPVAHPSMGFPVPPVHPHSPFPTGPVPPQNGSWLKSRHGITALSAAAAVLVIVIALVIGRQLLSDDNEPSAGDGTGQTEDGANDSTPGADGEEGSAGSGDGDGLVALADATQGDLVAEMPMEHTGAITAMATAELDGAPVVITGGEDAIVRIWNAADGKLIDEYRGHEYKIIDLGAVTDAEGRTAVFSSDDSTDATWYLDDPANPISQRESLYDTIFWYGMWDSTPAYATDYYVKQLFTGTQITSISTGYGLDLRLAEVDGTMRCVTHWENRLTVLDMETSEAVGGTFDQLPYEILGMNVGEVAGRSLAVTAASDGSIQAWDLASAETYGTAAKEMYQTVNGLSLFERDGKAVVIASGERGLSLFDLETGELIGESFAQFSADAPLTAAKVVDIDGHHVAVTGNALGQIQVWSL